MKITAIQTQGRNGYDQWVRQYKVSYSLDGKEWSMYKQQNGDDKVKL